MAAQSQLDDANLQRAAEISVKIREAVRAALPTGTDQYLHLMVPGKVLNLDVRISCS